MVVLRAFSQALEVSGKGARYLPLYDIHSNVLSKLLNNAAETGGFHYTPPFREVKLTHLSFADDIVVFTDSAVASLKGVLEVKREFAAMSGLHINATKSTIFAA